MLDRVRAYFVKKTLDPTSLSRIEYLESLFAIPIANPRLYLNALRHRSKIAGTGMHDSESYEQLEFLGDAVLDLVVAEMLFSRYPKKDEGFMTKARSRLVRGDSLAQLARKIRLHEYIDVGERAKNQGLDASDSIMADVFEAIIGAVYKDKGFSAAAKFIENVYTSEVNLHVVTHEQDNFKSVLLEYSQAQKLDLPYYEVIAETGPAHEKTFEVIVSIEGKVLGSGIGKNKKKAEQLAAKEAIEWLKKQGKEIQQ